MDLLPDNVPDNVVMDLLDVVKPDIQQEDAVDLLQDTAIQILKNARQNGLMGSAQDIILIHYHKNLLINSEDYVILLIGC
jgi:hypothetical protein